MEPRPIRQAILAASLAAALILIVPASAARAQGAPGFHIGVSGGAMIPIENESDAYNVGWNAMLVVPINFGHSPFGIRIDGSYSEIKPKSDVIAFTNGNTRIIDGTFDFVLGPHLGSFQPYIIGGVGIYDLRFTGGDVTLGNVFDNSTTRFGWNAGGGFAFQVGNSNTHIFVEGRYTSISLNGNGFSSGVDTGGTRFTLIPVNVGIIF